MQTNENPFFGKYDTPHGTIPFHRIETEHYEPAFKEGIARRRAEIERITTDPEAPTFENTIVALERSGEMLERVSSAFFHLLSAESNDEMMEISQRISPELTESENDIILNEKLFDRIRAVYEEKDRLHLNTEDSKLLEETYSSFAENGANLSPEEKEKFRRLKTELSLLTLTFDQNVLKDENRYEMLLTEETELAGLPESIREAAAARAAEKGKTGWMFDLTAPSYIPFMRYSARRDLRRKLYMAYQAVGNQNDAFDNKENIRKIIDTRLAVARLLGYDTYAHYALRRRMARTPGNVYRLLYDLLEAYRPAALNEYHRLEGFACGLENTNFRLMPWDWNYYSEKLKELTFRISDEATRPYFELEQVRKSIFALAGRLYGLTFCENREIPVYHADVTPYEVYDADGRFLAVFYTDFHPREGKQSGAWMNSIKGQYKTDGTDSRPHIAIVTNFTKPTATKPSLLTFDEVETFLHEFGHALHGMLADGTYESLSGTNVYRDFVELPSQLMENWLKEKEFLDLIAIHYQTGEKLPEDTVRRLIDAANFNAGYQCLRQVSFGLLDMAWHTLTEPFDGDPVDFEKTAWQAAQVLPPVEGTSMSSSFCHIFAGGYAAGYYGYKWAEVLDADAFSVFKEAGIFNRETAQAFREHILSKGGTEDPMALYCRFRGHEPTIDALLMRNGIKNNPQPGTAPQL